MRSVSIGRRGVAIIASLVLLAASVLPPAHIHFASSPTGQLIPLVAHQHLAPHRVAVEHDAASLWDHDDEGVVRTIDQQWLVPARTSQSLSFAAVLLETALVPPVTSGAQFRTVAPTVSPPDPFPKPDSLRGPPVPA